MCKCCLRYMSWSGNLGSVFRGTGLGVKGREVMLRRVWGGGLSPDMKALNESEMLCGRNNHPRRVFSLSGEILGCAIVFIYGAQ